MYRISYNSSIAALYCDYSFTLYCNCSFALYCNCSLALYCDYSLALYCNYSLALYCNCSLHAHNNARCGCRSYRRIIALLFISRFRLNIHGLEHYLIVKIVYFNRISLFNTSSQNRLSEFILNVCLYRTS